MRSEHGGAFFDRNLQMIDHTIGLVDERRALADNPYRGGKEYRKMKYLAFAALALFALVTAITVFVVVTASAANAVVCAKGVYRAGCAGPHGAVVAHRTYRGTYMRATRY